MKQTAFEVDQPLGSEAYPLRRDQDRPRRCMLQARKVPGDFERSDEHPDKRDLIIDLVKRLQTEASSRARHKPHCDEEMSKITGMKQDPVANRRASFVQPSTVVVKQTKISKTSQSIKETMQRKKPIIQDEVKR